MPRETYFSLVGSQAVVQQIRDTSGGLEVEFSEPVMADSPADLLDSPIGVSEVTEILQLVTVCASTSTALASLVAQIIAVLKRSRTESVQIVDMDGKVIGELSAEISPEVAQKLFRQ